MDLAFGDVVGEAEAADSEGSDASESQGQDVEPNGRSQVPVGRRISRHLSCASTLAVRNLEGSAGLDGIPRLQSNTACLPNSNSNSRCLSQWAPLSGCP